MKIRWPWQPEPVAPKRQRRKSKDMVVRSEIVSMRFTPEQMSLIDSLAAEADITRSQFIRDAIEARLFDPVGKEVRSRRYKRRKPSPILDTADQASPYSAQSG